MEENYRVAANFRWLGSELKSAEELCLTVCGIERCLPDKFYGPAIREDYHVHIILKGRGTLRIGDTSYSLHRGQIFVIPPDIETYYYACPEDPWFYTWVSFAGSRAAFFLEKSGITAQHPVRNTYVEPEKFLEIAEKILNHHELTAANELLRTSYLYEFLALLATTYADHLTEEQKQQPLDYSSDVYIRAAKDYIREHYRKVRVSEVADYIGISRYYLSHLFADKLSLSPQDYILNCRMDESKRLLRRTALTITEIADMVGYENPMIFSKTFKKRYGMTPSQYRTAHPQD